MSLDRARFYDSVRHSLFGGKILPKQFEGMEAILNAWEAKGLTDVRWLAYMMATTFHETGHTMQPIEEYGKGKGKKYGKKIKMNGQPYDAPDKLYYGRGLVQLTWFENYKGMGRLLNLKLLEYPVLALRMDIAVEILFEGMTEGHSSFGDFTGKCLEMYFNEKKNDPLNARRIINGMDKAELIEGYHYKFLDALI